MKIIIDKSKCCGSGECAKVCPENAITIVDGMAVVDHDKCDLDGLCIPACPYSAVSVDENP